ncbi:MAG: hypothetical protein NZ551_00775 [Microscillaceae bacterium]|nr:hypothetical protein [Microscillaceae bacterium]MDW8459722.1 hypothetical protein [Cytophagales bacterium]
MAWICLNCETHNPETEHVCQVCSFERLFTLAEVQYLLEHQKGTPSELEQELKKITANYKRSQTNQKKLAEERKYLQEQVNILEEQKKILAEQISTLQKKLHKSQQNNFKNKILLLFLATLTLLLMLTRVAISFRFY